MSDRRQPQPVVDIQAWLALAVGLIVIVLAMRRLLNSGELEHALCAAVDLFSWLPLFVWHATLPLGLGLCGLAVASLWLSRQRPGLAWLTLVPAWSCVAVFGLCGLTAAAPC